MGIRESAAPGPRGLRFWWKTAAVVVAIGLAAGSAWIAASRTNFRLRAAQPDFAVECFIADRETGLSQAPLRGAFLTTGDLDEAALVARFLDRGRDPNERLRYLRRLVQSNAPRAWRAVADGFFSETPANQAVFARVLASIARARFQESLLKALEAGNDFEAAAAIRALAIVGDAENFRRLTDIAGDDAWPDMLRREAAQALLRTGDERLCKQAIRSLALIGTENETADLAGILHGSSWSDSLRVQAAVALGKIASPRAGDELIAAFNEFADPEVHEVLIGSLGHFPFSRIGETWKALMDDPSTPTGLRAAAAEALASSSADAVPYLESLAAGDREADVREMAAWALSTQPPGGALGPRIAEMLRSENEPDVRRRLYESLLVQAENPTESVLDVIRQEDDPAARVAAMNAAGDAVGRRQAASLAAAFDSEMVPELQSVALGNSSPNLRMRAVFALRRAGTPAAKAALANISKTPAPEIATAARNGLQASR